METYGLEIENETYFASLYQNLGDNLGIHQVFNLKCCFTGENICHLCDASTESIQKKFNHGSFQTKLKRDYEFCEINMRIKIYGVLFTKDMYIKYENECKKYENEPCFKNHG